MQLPYFSDGTPHSAGQPSNPQLLPSPHLDGLVGHLQDLSSGWLAAPSPHRSVQFHQVDPDHELMRGSFNYIEDPIPSHFIQASQEQVDYRGLMDTNRLHHPTNTYDWIHLLSPTLTPSETIGDLPHTPPSRSQRPYHCAISRDAPPLSRIQLSRPLSITPPAYSTPPLLARPIWPSPASSAGNAGQSPRFSVQCSSPQHTSPSQQFLAASGDLRTALTFTTADLWMSEASHITRLQEYLDKQPRWSTDNALEICTSRDVLNYGETVQNTFRHIKGFLQRFSSISISLRNEPDSPNPSALGLMFDATDHCSPRAVIDLESAVNLKEFRWQGSAVSLTQIITGLPKSNIAVLRMIDCQISLDDATTIVKSFPNLQVLEIDMIDDHTDNVLHLSPLLSPTLAGSSKIDRLKITSSAPLQRFLQDIKFLESNTSVKSIQLIPYGIRDFGEQIVLRVRK
ncbi:hypothetical protein BJ912DRAFT_1043046 [Pholiota molesta]|nr:hypothetical protein BJ912DRAFT_1043046 [Pholiota molesta]